jgi:hypothetical protein
MAYSPDIRNEAFDLYLKGFSATQIHKELCRRHTDAELPSVKTLGEKWPYTADGNGKTWSELRDEANLAARDVLVKDFVSQKTKMLQGAIRIQQRLEERAALAIDQAATPDGENFVQEMYAYINATKFVNKELSADIASEARNKDAMDLLVEALHRMIPNFETEFKVKVLEEFKRLMAAKRPPGVERGA